MKLNVSLKDLERQFSLCIKCKQCTYGSWPKNLPICPINDQYKFFTYSGGGIIYLARGILLNMIERVNYDEVLEVISKCTSCGYCGQTCKLVKAGPPYQNVTDLIRLLKINLVKQDVYISEKHEQVINTIKIKHRPFDLPLKEEGLKALKSKAPNKGEVLIFSGCISSYKNIESLEAIIEILNKPAINYHMMKDEWCCGAPLIDLGNVDGIVKLAEHNLNEIGKIGVGKVIFLCPHCQETFKNIYPQVTGKEINFELVFFTKYLKELIEKDELKHLKSISYKISYHDSCYLGRYLGDFDSARDVFKKIPKIEFVEMNRNREDTYCCGAGGGAKILDYDNSIAIGLERIKDFKKTGADVLVTSCPLCKSQFHDLIRYTSEEIVVKDVIEILRESLN